MLDLNHRVIKGYSSYNVIAVTPHDKKVHLLSHELYSNKSPSFLKAEYVSKLVENKDFPEKESVLNLYESGKWFNKKTLAKATIHMIMAKHRVDRILFEFLNNKSLV